MSSEDDEEEQFAAFVALHAAALSSSGVPRVFWNSLFHKITHEVYCACASGIPMLVVIFIRKKMSFPLALRSLMLGRFSGSCSSERKRRKLRRRATLQLTSGVRWWSPGRAACRSQTLTGEGAIAGSGMFNIDAAGAVSVFHLCLLLTASSWSITPGRTAWNMPGSSWSRSRDCCPEWPPSWGWTFTGRSPLQKLWS